MNKENLFIETVKRATGMGLLVNALFYDYHEEGVKKKAWWNIIEIES